MPRLELALSIFAAAAVACADDTTAVTTGSEASTTAPTTGPDTTTGPTTADAQTTTSEPTGPSTITGVTTTTATDSTTGPVTTTDTATTTDPTTASTTEPATVGTTDPETTTGGGLCGVEGDMISADLAHMGKPAPCGPLEFTGTRISDQKGPVWQLDGCACGDSCLIPDPWTLSVSAPAAWLPLLPACPRIVVDRVEGFNGCQFAAISVWDLQAPGEPAVYHAGHGLAPTQAGAAELTITPHSVETCDCMGCCQPAERWDLQFSLDGADVTLGEGESAPLGPRNAINFESHHIGLCDAPLDVHWAIRKPA
ncbi:hypothetical protein SAMN02745121_07017 [Nannocystis exedens]|uniref:Uncharacterized protein n=1 Tax=Nannocystis exedens TaxID=54 RepID=A0A1I2G5I0_9BACT|nr:hypothetical protein [Nannocystis exedens]PCC67335.1 hypothetical protein NAEX_00339 [Nannocystis exedens]SFF11996.1 hypothetical protein SAMN02745121_07017 [Nannocystis exedens]